MIKTATQTLRFEKNKENDFFSTVKQRVEEYFETKQISKKANALMIFKIIFYLSLWAGTYYFLVFVNTSIPVMYLLWAILGFSSAFIGLNICHDAIHGSVSENRYINMLLGYPFYLIGANVYIWNISHNMVHHTYTNIDGYDEDITPVPLLRMSPHQPLKKIHKYQHIYVFFLYALASFSWAFMKDYKKFFQKNIGNHENFPHPRIEYVKLFGFKLAHYMLYYIIPFMYVQASWWNILLGILLMHWCMGYTLTFIFNLAHVVEGTDYPLPNENTGNIENNWAIHQMYTTANFARENDLLNFFFGGLNFQVEHHLFPKISHVHYKALSRIVERTSKEFGVPYMLIPTFGAAIASHIKVLKELGSK